MKKDCDNCFYSGRPSYEYPCSDCNSSYDNPPTKWELKSEPKTNGDRIRAMTDEELADFITNCGCYDHARDCRASCKDCTMDWLKQPVED